MNFNPGDVVVVPDDLFDSNGPMCSIAIYDSYDVTVSNKCGDLHMGEVAAIMAVSKDKLSAVILTSSGSVGWITIGLINHF